MTSMTENHRRDYSDEEDVDDDQKRLLSNHTPSSPTQSDQRYYYPDHEDIENGDETGFSKPKRKIHLTCVALVSVLLIAWIIWSLAMGQLFQIIFGDHDSPEQHVKTIGLNDLYNSTFSPKRPTLVWVEQDAQDGVFTYRDPQTNDILLESVESGDSQVYIEQNDLTIDGKNINVDRFEISQDAQYLTIYTNTTKQFRWSYKVNVFIYHIQDKTLTPLNDQVDLTKTPIISYTKWSPKGHQLAYVMNNDIYTTKLDGKPHFRVTFDGSDTVRSGVPDWVFEEEVFGKEFTLWWSPDSTYLAYLRFNETGVPEYQVPLYTASNKSAYPENLTIRYPKAGSPNPIVSLHLHSIETKETIMVTKNQTSHPLQSLSTVKDFDDDDRLITDVAWVTDSHTHLLFKQTNRVQDHEITSLVTLSNNNTASIQQTASVKAVREYKPEDGGWIDIGQSMVFLPNHNGEKSDSTIQYLDIADDDDGYTHLAIFTIKKGSNHAVPYWLTSGDWEVIAGSVIVDKTRKLVHFFSTERSFLERHLYTISLDHKVPSFTKKCLTCPEDPDIHAYYSADFSPKAGYYILNYLGPDVPRTVVRKIDDDSFESVLADNAALKKLLAEYDLPRIRMSTVKSGGIDMPAMEVLPPGFDINKKYPVLFHVYGGPGSQLVSYQFALDWHTYIASQFGFIVVTVDGRGTGFQGREYRSVVRGKLGELETIDQVNAAKHWSTLDYVDESRIAIWGWSYGGYMTTKVIESNDGVFRAGLAVAPVTDWRFYDSVYTERYMLTPSLNPEGYENSAVNNMTGFENADYLLIHGTGDDNVHFQHSAVLVDKLTMANIHRYRVQFYPDSNHRISYHNANPNVYYLLTEFLYESFGGNEYMHIREETHGHYSK